LIPLGAFSVNRTNYWIGKLAATGYVLNQYRMSNQDGSSKVDTGSKLFGIWGQPLLYAGAGWGIVKSVKNPVGQFVAYALLAGAITSDRIDRKKGLDNYWGFVSGGYLGNTPNYGAYFNVYANISTILDDRKKKSPWSALVEDAYIAAYWKRKETLATHRAQSGEFNHYL
jgi:hypothetical protein